MRITAILCFSLIEGHTAKETFRQSYTPGRPSLASGNHEPRVHPAPRLAVGGYDRHRPKAGREACTSGQR